MELLTALNDTAEVLINLHGVDVELGRFFSTEGYRKCTLFALGIDGGLYKVTTEYKEGAPVNGTVGTICYKKEFEVSEKFKNVEGDNKQEDLQLEHFLRAVKVNDWDDIVTFDRNVDINTVKYIYDAAFAIYSPILHL